MPTYDYLCEKCGIEFEREQRITEDPIKTCPECKGRKVKRLLSAPGFILKGGGWYADGYGSSGGKSSSSGDDSTTSSSSNTSDSTSDSSASSESKSSSSGSDKSKSSGGSDKKGKGKGGSKSKQSAA